MPTTSPIGHVIPAETDRMTPDAKEVGGTLLMDGPSALSDTTWSSIDTTQTDRAETSHQTEPQHKADPDALAGMLTCSSILRITGSFLAVALVLWAAAQGVRLLCTLSGVAVDVPSKWPLSIVKLTIPGIQNPLYELCVSAGVFLLLFYLVRRMPRPLGGGLSRFSRRENGTVPLPDLTGGLPQSSRRENGTVPLPDLMTSPFAVIVAGFLLVLATNLIHGPQYGLVRPHEGPLHYYHDAVRVTSAGQFLREFEAGQADLSCHSRTHPPGAVLFLYALASVGANPAAMSLAIAALSVGLSGIFLYQILSHEFGRETAGYVTFLFLLIPSIQIYYCAALDAIIASCSLGVLLLVRNANPLLSVLGTIACLFLASFLTFGACFLVPVIVGFEIITRRSVRRSVAILLGVAVLYGAIHSMSGFNYPASFRIASALENPQGFMLFAEPASYVMTRLENICEIILFFGPFLLLLFVLGTRTMLREGTHRELMVLSTLGIFTLLAMFLTGAFRTGETARTCLFIYPYLIFPVAAFLHHHACRAESMKRLLYVVWAQTVAMQTFGGYHW